MARVVQGTPRNERIRAKEGKPWVASTFTWRRAPSDAPTVTARSTCARRSGSPDRACVARHHAGCWKERGACAACGERAYLKEVAPEKESAPIELRCLRIEAQLARLEREWAERRSGIGTRTRYQGVVDPSPGEVTAAWIAVAFALMVAAGFAAAEVYPASLAGLIVASMATLQAITSRGRLAFFNEAHASYRARRERLLRDLEEARRERR